MKKISKEQVLTILNIIAAIFIISCIVFMIAGKCSRYVSNEVDYESSSHRTNTVEEYSSSEPIHFESSETVDLNIEKMNATELHYDASGPLVIYDYESQLVGLYDGSTPLDHIYTEFDCGGGILVTTVGELDDNLITVSEAVQVAFSENSFDDDVPVVVIGK